MPSAPSDSRCTCYVRGEHGEKPRKKVMPAKKSVMGHYLPAVETDDPRCPVHGIAGRKIKRSLGLSS